MEASDSGWSPFEILFKCRKMVNFELLISDNGNNSQASVKTATRSEMQWDWHEYWWGLFAIENTWQERQLKDCHMFQYVLKHNILLIDEVWIPTIMNVLVVGTVINCGSMHWKCLIWGNYAWRNWKIWSVPKMACCKTAIIWLEDCHGLVANGTDHPWWDFWQDMKISSSAVGSLMAHSCLSLEGSNGVLTRLP